MHALLLRIPYSIAYRLSLAFFALSVAFHLLVITGLLPDKLVWGGRLRDPGKLGILETVALLVNLMMGMAVWFQHQARVKSAKFNTHGLIMKVMGVFFSVQYPGEFLFGKPHRTTGVYALYPCVGPFLFPTQPVGKIQDLESKRPADCLFEGHLRGGRSAFTVVSLRKTKRFFRLFPYFR